MKIIALQAENVKKIVVVEIRPDGNLVQITGKNGHGKTSVLDSIFWALAGASNIQAVPIRKGAKTAKIRLDLGEIIVTRKFKAGKHGGATSSLLVESKDGATFQSPQKMLDDLFGALSFDPLAFSRMSPREQFDTLKKFAPGVNFDHIEEMNKAEFERRATLNRQAKDARSRAEGIELPPKVPDKLVDETKLMEKLEKAGKHNGEILARKENRKNAAVNLKDMRDKIAELQEDAAKLEKRIKTAPKLPEPIDVEQLRESIESARCDNMAFSDSECKKSHEKDAEDSEEKAEKLTDSMAEREEEKQKAIASAKLPVKGITFGVGEVLMGGVPFNQASDAEQLRASIGIAMSLNPKLRVIRVRDGSLMDEDSMKLLAKMADEADCQVWVERVDGSGKVGFVLEDGSLKKHTLQLGEVDKRRYVDREITTPGAKLLKGRVVHK